MNYPWQATVQDDEGSVIVSPVITVWEGDGVTLADIYDESGTPVSNPLTGSLEGFVRFWAAAGEYQIEGSKGSENTERWFWKAGVDLADIAGAAGLTQVVRVDEAQTLTSGERSQALANISAVSYDAQALNNGQKQRACENIAALSYEAQSLASGQRQQARQNIAALSSETQALDAGQRLQACENIAAVSYDAQSLSDAQRVQARNNIRAALNPDSAQGGAWYRVYAAANTAMIVPAGGRWACFYIRRNTSSGGMNGADAGVYAGGTNLFTTTSNEDANMLVWRVA